MRFDPGKERCVCKCCGSESVWDTFTSVLHSNHQPEVMLDCLGSDVAGSLKAVRKWGRKWARAEWRGGRRDGCWGFERLEGSPGSGVTWRLSNGGSGGSNGSSAGTMTSIPWCLGAEWNLGCCFGNQGGSQRAEWKRERRKHVSEHLKRCNFKQIASANH